jgi:D-amino-acid dehydrogenase
VTIVGAGIVGVATAIYLQREGHKVTLVERADPGEAASQGNAGSLAPGSIIPLALPGTMRQVPGWILDPLGPLSFAWSQVPALIPWLLHFRRACTAGQVARSATAMRSLNRESVDTYSDLLGAAGAPDLMRRDGMLHAYRTERGFDGSAYARKLRTDNGAALQVVDAAEIRRLEPQLSQEYRWGFLLPEGGHVRDPLKVVQALVHHFAANGGTVVRAEVRNFATARDRVSALVTSEGSMPVDQVVIAAGIWSRGLLAQLGLRVPVAPERGYHVQIPAPGVGPRSPVTDGENRFVATPMLGGLRIAGTSEFSALDTPPNWKRAEVLARLAGGMFPGLNLDGYSRWSGFRPSTPDSLPVIGRSPRHSGVFLALGHGHWGLMAAPATGQVIADLVAGRPPRLDITPFQPDRF